MSYRTLDDALRERRILITCGTGGVGKTTLSAALAIRAALLGKKAIVITIDPAKRLATSLGLDSLGDHPADLTPQLRNAAEQARKAGARKLGELGSLAAVIPDTRRTFETFIASLASNEAEAKKILENPIFQIFARDYSGTNEYMAIQRLFSIWKLNEYDCIILDTPPSRNTLALLDAPNLLAQFFDEKIIKWLVLPANRLVSAGMKKALGLLERLTGARFMGYLFDFAQSLFGVRENFLSNLSQVRAMLESDKTGFVLVTTPTPETAPEVAHFVESIHEHGYNFDGIALNRTHGDLKASARDSEQAAEGTRAALELIEALRKREGAAIRALQGELDSTSVPLYAKLPELARDVHSVEDLFHVAMALDHHQPS